MKNKMLLIIGMVFLISLVSAKSDLGYFAPNSCINLPQTCATCTQNSITSIIISNGGNTPTILTYTPNLIMTTTDSYTYNYTFCNTSTLGTYYVNGWGNPDGTNEIWGYQFEIGIPLLIVVIVMIFGYGIAILGFFKYRNEWISMSGGMLMLILGFYLTSFGVSIYNNTLTLAVGYLTIALGAVAALVPIGEILETNLNWFDNR
jgi:hypothetical protein